MTQDVPDHIRAFQGFIVGTVLGLLILIAFFVGCTS